jgi:pyruvate carboxylase
MRPFRAKLTDDAGHAIADIEGSIQSAEETRGPRQGEFQFNETESFMQGVLEEQTFRLEVDDGSQLAIHVNSVSTVAEPGKTKVEFNCL